jgi:hypothetical protein
MQKKRTLEVTKTGHWRLQRWSIGGYKQVQRRYDRGTVEEFWQMTACAYHCNSQKYFLQGRKNMQPSLEYTTYYEHHKNCCP